ncbi:putative reverse transcriptase domain-containing protein [Tanacetum coccineum]
MPPRMRTRNAGRSAAKSLKGGTGVRVGRGGRCRRLREGNDDRVGDLNGQGNNQVLTRWIGKMEKVQDMSGFSVDQKVKYTAGSFVGKALTWAGHAAYTDMFHELARLVPHLVTPESRKIKRYAYSHALEIRMDQLRRLRKEEMWGEPSKDTNGRDDNKRTRTGNAFATTANPVGRENMGVWPKCTTCHSYHVPGGPCRTCFNCNRPGHLANDCRSMPRNVNPANDRNPTVRACYECGSTDHVRPACPRLKWAQGPGGNPPNQIVANNEGRGRGN